MYEHYTRQALPSEEYRILLGTAICVFNANNNFIIENILRHDTERIYSQHELVDRTSGNLRAPIKQTITKKSNSNISDLFYDLIERRNRIIHSFQITVGNKEQLLATKDRDQRQFIITKAYLMEFIKKNEALSSLLHEFRGY